MDNVEKIREGLYIKKGFDGYRVVYPMKNEDGSMNWKNIISGGSYWNFVKIAIILGIIVFLTWSYMHDTRECREFTKQLQENPSEICGRLMAKPSNIRDNYIQVDTSNWSKVVIGGNNVEKE